MCFIDDDNLVREIDIERLSGILLQKKIVRQGHELKFVSACVSTVSRIHTYLGLLDSSSGRIIRTHTSPFSLSDDILDILDTGLSLSIQLGQCLVQTKPTSILSLASSIVPSSSFFGKYSHRSLPIVSALIRVGAHVPDFCMSKQASFRRSSPPVRAKARTLSLMQSCLRLPRGTNETGTGMSGSSDESC